MTDQEKKIIGKQIAIADNFLSLATLEVNKISFLLHKFGYLYNATEAENEIIFVPCDENYDTLNALDEKYSLDELVKGGKE